MNENPGKSPAPKSRVYAKPEIKVLGGVDKVTRTASKDFTTSGLEDQGDIPIGS